VPLFIPNYGTIHPESGNCHFSVKSKQFFIPMVNYYDKNRFISKSELARLADVSPRTFTRYLATRRHILDATGITSFKRLVSLLLPKMPISCQMYP
jgi:hypothetical protein